MPLSHETDPCQDFHAFLMRFLQFPERCISPGLSNEDVQQAFRQEGVSFGKVKHCIFTPALILWAFVSQVLHDDKSCDGAVARIRAYLLEKGLELCENTNSAYCKARQKLSEGLLQHLALMVARRVDESIPNELRWKGREVNMIDGFVATMPDTEANQQEYEQPSSQKSGLGFPMIRIVGVFSLATAVLKHAAMGPYKGKQTGELALLRSLLDQLTIGSILLADRFFCSYFMIALLMESHLDVVFRLHARRKYDFRKGERLGKDDHLVVWQKPAKPQWMPKVMYERMPETLTVREVKTEIRSRGQKTETLVVITTLLDSKVYTKTDLTDLYQKRWLVELDIRTIKTYQQMDHLRCKSPSMVRKEIWAHFLGYNLVRQAMAQAALVYDLSPRQLGYRNALRQLVEFEKELTHCSGDKQDELLTEILHAISKRLVQDRPNRVEPRAVKRRPKPYPRLSEPRAQARARLQPPIPQIRCCRVPSASHGNR